MHPAIDREATAGDKTSDTMTRPYSQIYTPTRILSYVVASDNGLAPNITGGICTLTVCKPLVRQVATVGVDWIVGMSHSRHGRNRVIYAMQVGEKIPFGTYFLDPRFACKKPDADKKGDNFFQAEDDAFVIPFSCAAHYGKPDKIARNLKAPWAIIGHQFWYFGGSAPELPRPLHGSHLALAGRGRRGHRVTIDPQQIEIFKDWIKGYRPGIHSTPRDKIGTIPSAVS